MAGSGMNSVAREFSAKWPARLALVWSVTFAGGLLGLVGARLHSWPLLFTSLAVAMMMIAIDYLRDSRQREIEKLQEALAWCGGSYDFAPGGIAYEGWRKLVRPLLDRAPRGESSPWMWPDGGPNPPIRH
jgi:hypothetical protein